MLKKSVEVFAKFSCETASSMSASFAKVVPDLQGFHDFLRITWLVQQKRMPVSRGSCHFLRTVWIVSREHAARCVRHFSFHKIWLYLLFGHFSQKFVPSFLLFAHGFFGTYAYVFMVTNALIWCCTLIISVQGLY